MEGTREAIDRIVELAGPTIEVIEDRTYSSQSLQPIIAPAAPVMEVHGLTALVEFLRWEFPGGLADLLAVVRSERVVDVVGRVDEPWKKRPVMAQALFGEATKLPFGQYVDQQTFVIGIQVGFIQDETTAKLLQLVGTIRDSKVLDLKDDGTTQQVSASAGLAKVSLVDVPNPVTLRPYRTFPEVEQPDSMYVLRAKSGHGDDLPSVALFMVEDPSWRYCARLSIAGYIKKQLADLTVIA